MEWEERMYCQIEQYHVVAAFRSKLSRYLIIYGENKSIAAFLQMQFFVDDDDDTPVLYMYDKELGII